MTFMNMTLIEWMPMIMSFVAAAVVLTTFEILRRNGKKPSERS